MAVQVLPFPASPKAAAASGMQAGSDMHCRFEARRLGAFILGPRPQVKILQIAWLEKQQHIVSFLDEYYELHKTLPRGRHDLGATETHGLRLGVLDFDRVRGQMQQTLPRESGRWRRWRQLKAFLVRKQAD